MTNEKGFKIVEVDELKQREIEIEIGHGGG